MLTIQQTTNHYILWYPTTYLEFTSFNTVLGILWFVWVSLSKMWPYYKVYGRRRKLKCNVRSSVYLCVTRYHHFGNYEQKNCSHLSKGLSCKVECIRLVVDLNTALRWPMIPWLLAMLNWRGFTSTCLLVVMK